MSIFKTNKMTSNEVLFSYSNSQDISMRTGLVGYVRADMGTNGTEFFHSWFGFNDQLNTPEFKNDLDNVIYSFRESGEFLSSRDALLNYCLDRDNTLRFDNGREYGVRVNTKDYAYLLRLNPNNGEYNLYCYCYKKDWLDSHLQKANKGIRFIDTQYNELFRLADGDEIIIMKSDGSFDDSDGLRDCPAKYTVRYIDDCHFEYGCNVRHICEFAELVEKSGRTVVPLRASLPNQCYVYVQTERRIGIVKKGESGYYKTDIAECNNIKNHVKAKTFVDELNKRLGVTTAQAKAMMVGSMCGWHVPGANPKNYDEHGKTKPIKEWVKC